MNGLFKFCILLFLCFCFKTGVSQESFQKHTVSDGETIASIAKKYLVTAFELQQANPGVLSEINVNDVLNIPQTNINATQLKSASDSIRASIVSGPTEYTVKSGDTKFSLARRFGLTIKALEARNPHSVPTLQEGQILNVPNVLKKESHNNLESYVVTKFDTKFGLAKKFNTTIPELERINPNIVEMLLIGQTVKIPSDKINVSTNDELPEINTTTPQQSKTPTRPTKKPIGIKTSPAVKEAIVTNKNLAQPSLDKQAKIQQADDKISKHTSSKYANLTGSLKTSKQKKLLFFLPFSQS
jgi:LysM repeat protein